MGWIGPAGRTLPSLIKAEVMHQFGILI